MPNIELRRGEYCLNGPDGELTQYPTTSLSREVLKVKGTPHQAMKMIEELHELAIAILNTMSSDDELEDAKIQLIRNVLIINDSDIRNGIDVNKVSFNPMTQSEVLSEMADVFIVLNQMLKVYDPHCEITAYIKTKEGKLRTYLDDEAKKSTKENKMVASIRDRFDAAMAMIKG